MRGDETISVPAAVWASPFRPFYLLGSLYGLVLVTAWAGAFHGLWRVPAGDIPLHLWHGHEMLFGFAAAIIVGIVLTALPSWAGTPEIRGMRLVLLVILWIAGRIAYWAQAWLPPPWPVLFDLLLFPAVFVMVAPQLLRASNRLYLLLLPILFALFAANFVHHVAASGANLPVAGAALRGAIYAIIVLYVLKGGVLTPIFTGNALRERGRGDQAPFEMPLEVACMSFLLLLAALDLAGAPSSVTGLAAVACALAHGWRVARWKGWLVIDVPMVFVMHLGFAWLVFAFALKAIAELTALVPESAWVHAFTLGSLGMMMLGLMMRVSLRHTGRPLVVPRMMLVACVTMFCAALLRLAATVHDLGDLAILLAAFLWAISFALYFIRFASTLLTASLPRGS
jgi:uncharacterized protein involved in response to NO